MKADGILEIPQGQEGFEAGESVNIRLLRPMDRLQHTLMTIGSHDPILDEMSDLLHRADPRLFMSSSHVGSHGRDLCGAPGRSPFGRGAPAG